MQKLRPYWLAPSRRETPQTITRARRSSGANEPPHGALQFGTLPLQALILATQCLELRHFSRQCFDLFVLHCDLLVFVLDPRPQSCHSSRKILNLLVTTLQLRIGFSKDGRCKALAAFSS